MSFFLSFFIDRPDPCYYKSSRIKFCVYPYKCMLLSVFFEQWSFCLCVSSLLVLSFLSCLLYLTRKLFSPTDLVCFPVVSSFLWHFSFWTIDSNFTLNSNKAMLEGPYDDITQGYVSTSKRQTDRLISGRTTLRSSMNYPLCSLSSMSVSLCPLFDGGLDDKTNTLSLSHHRTNKKRLLLPVSSRLLILCWHTHKKNNNSGKRSSIKSSFRQKQFLFKSFNDGQDDKSDEMDTPTGSQMSKELPFKNIWSKKDKTASYIPFLQKRELFTENVLYNLCCLSRNVLSRKLLWIIFSPRESFIVFLMMIMTHQLKLMFLTRTLITMKIMQETVKGGVLTTLDITRHAYDAMLSNVQCCVNITHSLLEMNEWMNFSHH